MAEHYGSKWVTHGRWHIGLAGSLRALSALRLGFQAGLFNAELVSTVDGLARQMREALVADRWRPAVKDDDGYSPSYNLQFLATDGDEIWDISGGFCVSSRERFAVSGSGMQVATGFAECAESRASYADAAFAFVDDVIRACIKHREDCGGEPWVSFVPRSKGVVDQRRPIAHERPIPGGWKDA